FSGVPAIAATIVPGTLLTNLERPVAPAGGSDGRGEAIFGHVRPQHVGAVPGRIDPLADDASRLGAAVGHVLGAGAGRPALLHEAIVIERSASRHVGGNVAYGCAE